MSDAGDQREINLFFPAKSVRKFATDLVFRCFKNETIFLDFLLSRLKLISYLLNRCGQPFHEVFDPAVRLFDTMRNLMLDEPPFDRQNVSGESVLRMDWFIIQQPPIQTSQFRARGFVIRVKNIRIPKTFRYLRQTSVCFRL